MLYRCHHRTVLLCCDSSSRYCSSPGATARYTPVITYAYATCTVWPTRTVKMQLYLAELANISCA